MRVIEEIQGRTAIQVTFAKYTASTAKRGSAKLLPNGTGDGMSEVGIYNRERHLTSPWTNIWGDVRFDILA
jgi:hypothetical protein